MTKRNYQEMMLKYQFAEKKIKTELEIMLQEYAFTTGYNPVEHIKSRIKAFERIKEKLKKKDKKMTTDNIMRYVCDVVGIRIVCSFIDDVYTIVNLIGSTGEFIVKGEKDYIKEPKESGYRSYHMIILVPIHLESRTEYVQVEVQIRTVAMDCWASLDHKLRYKVPGQLGRELEKELVLSANDMLEIDKKMQCLANVIKEKEK